MLNERRFLFEYRLKACFSQVRNIQPKVCAQTGAVHFANLYSLRQFMTVFRTTKRYREEVRKASGRIQLKWYI